jgi:hypothetical protein
MADGVSPSNGDAPGWPGHDPRWTSSTKSAVGTAYGSQSRVWFTISHGIVNEPTTRSRRGMRMKLAGCSMSCEGRPPSAAYFRSRSGMIPTFPAEHFATAWQQVRRWVRERAEIGTAEVGPLIDRAHIVPG